MICPMIATDLPTPRNSKHHPRFSVRRVMAFLAERGAGSTSFIATNLHMSMVEVGWCLCRLQEVGMVKYTPSQQWTFTDERSLDLF